MSLVHIRNLLLSKYDGAIGPLRVVYSQSGAETNRTLAVLPTQLYDLLVKQGYGRRDSKGLSISPYTVNERHYPRTSQRDVWYIPLPRSFELSEVQIRDHLNRRLEELAELGLLPADSWRIAIPLKSRTSGERQGFCFVSFVGASLLDISTAKLVIDDTAWLSSGGEAERLFCLWSRQKKQRKPEPKVKKILVNEARLHNPQPRGVRPEPDQPLNS